MWIWKRASCICKENVQYPVLRRFQVPGSSVELQTSVFLTVFLSSSQFLRSLNAFWSWGGPGTLRTYTNAPELQNDWVFLWSRRSLISFLRSFVLVLFSLWGFSQASVCSFWFSGSTGTSSGVPLLASFCIIVIYCTCNELVSIATFNSRSFWGLEWGWNFLHTKTTEAFVKT